MKKIDEMTRETNLHGLEKIIHQGMARRVKEANEEEKKKAEEQIRL